MQVPILSGIYVDSDADIRTAYPVNMEPIPKQSGLSQGYLRTAQGLEAQGVGPGVCRGGIEWNGVCYRVMGSAFGKVADGAFVEIGNVGAGGPVTLDYGFDYLAIASNGKLFFYNGKTLTQNTDTDLGEVLDVVWLDGYYVTTDGEFLVSTELRDPFAINPLKYGSSEEDADPVLAVKKLGSELYAVNRHTIETFTNVGGTFFPFQVIDGTQSYRGAVGTHAVIQFMGRLAFVGSARNEPPAVYLSASGSDAPLSTSEIDAVLAKYTAEELAGIVCETRRVERRDLLYIHLPDQTLVYDGAASAALGQPVWFFLRSTSGPYRARYFVWHGNDWTLCDTKTASFGRYTDKVATHWGDLVSWEFATPVVFNETRGMVCHELTLTGMTGVTLYAGGATISVEFTEDGATTSQRREITLGQRGNREVPIKWTRVGHFRDYAAFKFSGDSNARLSVARLDATLEVMQW